MIANAAFDVKNYGAIGDGIVDDTAAIQATIAAGAGKQVYLPAGNYKISSTLEIPSNTTFYGDGKSSTFLSMVNNVAAILIQNEIDIAVKDFAIITSSAQTNPVIRLEGLSVVVTRCDFDGIQIGSPGGATGLAFICIYLYAEGNNGAVWNCNFTDMAFSGVGSVVTINCGTGPNRYISNNRFEKFYVNDFIIGIHFVNEGNGCTFRDWGTQCSARTSYGLLAYLGGSGSVLDGVQWIDMTQYGNTAGKYYFIGETISDISILPAYGDTTYDEDRIVDHGINTLFPGKTRYFMELIDKGFYNELPTNTDWTQTVTNSGSTIQGINYLQTRTGATANSSATLTSDDFYGFSTSSFFAVNYNNMVIWTFDIARFVEGTNCKGRIQLLTNTSSAGQLAAKGIGLYFEGNLFYAESFGDTGEFLNIGTITPNVTNKIKIIVYGGIRAEWWVNDVWKAQQLVPTKIPYGQVITKMAVQIVTAGGDTSDCQLFVLRPRLYVASSQFNS